MPRAQSVASTAKSRVCERVAADVDAVACLDVGLSGPIAAVGVHVDVVAPE